MEHRVIYNQGEQTLYHVPMDRSKRVSRPTSATYSIVDLRRGEDDADREVVAETAATIDAVSTTTDAACGNDQANANRIPLTSTTGIVENHTYLLQAADGTREPVRVVAIVTNDYVESAYQLRAAYASGSTFKGVEIAGAFPAAEADDEDEVEGGGGPYLVEWAYTLSGFEHIQRDTVFIARGSMPHLATVEDMLLIMPNLDERYGDDSTPLERSLKQAHRAYSADLQVSGIDPAYYLAGEAGRQAVSHLAIWYLVHKDIGEDADTYREIYNKYFGSMTEGNMPQGTVTPSAIDDTATEGTSRKTHSVMDLS